MTLYPPLWADGATYPGIGDRGLIGALFGTDGVTTDIGLRVTQRAAGANMSVDVAAGTAAITGTDAAGQGRYLCVSDAVVNVPVNPAPGAGTSRIDRIYAQARDGNVVGGDSEFIVGYVAGTAAASPSAPSLPSSSTALAQFTVLSSTTTITTGMITDQRRRAQLGAQPMVHAVFDFPNHSVGQGSSRILNLTSPNVRPSVFPASLFWSAGTPAHATAPWTGLYDLSVGVQSSGGPGGGQAQYLRIEREIGSVVAHMPPNTDSGSGGNELYVSVPSVWLVAGQALRVRVQNNSGGSRTYSSPDLHRVRFTFKGTLGDP